MNHNDHTPSISAAQLAARFDLIHLPDETDEQLMARCKDKICRLVTFTRKEVRVWSADVARVRLKRVVVSTLEPGCVLVAIRWPWWRCLWFGWRERRSEAEERIQLALQEHTPIHVGLKVRVQ